MVSPQSHERRQAIKALRNQSIKTITGYTIIGFCNVVLANIVFSASYLVIPYSRPVVLLIQLLPALAAKLLTPFLLPFLPWRLRPWLFAACWSLAIFVTSVTPANVPAVWRVLMTALAAATAAATEVSCAGHLRHFGRAGLAGWGIGTGAASLLAAVAPYFLSVSLHVPLRAAVGHAHYFIGAALVAGSMILRRPPVFTTTTVDSIKFDARAAEEGGSFVVLEPPAQGEAQAQTWTARIEHNLRLVDPLAKPYIRSLCFAFTLQALVAPGIARALARSDLFAHFETFTAVYGLAFQAGNLVSRSTILLVRVRHLNRLTSLLAVLSAAVLLNGVAALVSSPYLVLPTVFAAGLLGGAVYANVFASALEQMAVDRPADAEFGLGVIGVGETAGTLCGSLLAALAEQSLCGVDAGTGTRWCYTKT
ncbi:CLN3 protein [Cordyceps fumosorosea ARSEF 2679]|uniref:Protein BTN n=1 Tax=Cordyceps fumosorosea (strain ARSEF 2679) TaxID=1081104 RepID=A0A168BUW9_CORFA|nr:CLN3 protein [Cordyceps fumosorosea ARSEF 2679]OAA70580.1 CLN3 protein [Cordyceps fumosorosea ARSEF 2679]